jgi:Sec-independent protein secretion pathway component TatC
MKTIFFYKMKFSLVTAMAFIFPFIFAQAEAEIPWGEIIKLPYYTIVVVGSALMLAGDLARKGAQHLMQSKKK